HPSCNHSSLCDARARCAVRCFRRVASVRYPPLTPDARPPPPWHHRRHRSIPAAMFSGRALAVAVVLPATVVFACSSCDNKALDTKGGPQPSASASMGLTPELAAKVLARVGDREITLGEYAATLQRMDQFERLRYQSPERRKLLLDEMIKVELLAAEAQRRG